MSLSLQIETTIVEFESVVGAVDQQLTASSQFFTNTVSKFDGTVTLSASLLQPSAVPLINIRVRREVQLLPSRVNASYVITSAQAFIGASKTNNVTGRAVYMKIIDQYEKVCYFNNLINSKNGRPKKKGEYFFFNISIKIFFRLTLSIPRCDILVHPIRSIHQIDALDE